MHYAARIHSCGIGCARWSATSFLRLACSSALIEVGSSRNSGPMAMAFLTAGRSPISSSQRLTFGNSSISIFRVAQRGAAAHRLVVDDRRHPAVRRNLQKFGSELVPAADIDRFDRVRKPQLFEKNDDLLAVSGRPRSLVFSYRGWAAQGRMPVGAL